MIGPTRLPRSGSVLALTGGGILARFTTEVLCHLQTIRSTANGTQAPLRDAFDMMAGTSAGALVIGGLAIGRTPQELSDLFDRQGAQIFPTGYWRTIRHFVMAKYSRRPLEAAIEEALQGEGPRLGEISQPIALPALNEATGTPVVFTNMNYEYADLYLRDVILASAAAPTYFPAVQIRNERHVDGGIFANAPDIAAIGLLRRRWPNLHLQDIHVLSIGTTNAHSASRSGPGKSGNWGLIQWMTRPKAHLLTMTLRAQADFTIALAPQLDLADFVRIDAELTDAKGQAYAIDDASAEARKALAKAARPAIAALGARQTASMQRIIRRNRFALELPERIEAGDPVELM